MTVTARPPEVRGASSFLTTYHERVQPAERRLTRTGRAVVLLTVTAALLQVSCAAMAVVAGRADPMRLAVCLTTAVMALTVTTLWLAVIRDRRMAFGLLDRCAEIVEGEKPQP